MRRACAACASISSSGWSMPRRARCCVEIAERIQPLGWHIVIYFEAQELPELYDFFARCRRSWSSITWAGRTSTKPVDGPEFELFVKLMREHENFWSKVSGAERLSRTGPPGYDDVVPFARRIVETFPDRVLWGTDWPHPNLKSHMPDDGQLVDLIPRIAPTAVLRHKLLVRQPACACTGPKSSEHVIYVARQTLSRYSRHDGLRRRPVARKGYHLNRFCMSLMKAENRARFKANERAYLDEWPMTRRAEAGGARARLQPPDRARRQHLLPRQDLRDRRQELPVRRGADDRHEPGGVRDR